MGKVIAVCTSDRRGIQKHDVNSGYFEVNWGIDGDAHAGQWHRQVSLLSADRIAAFNEKGAGVIPGAFGSAAAFRSRIQPFNAAIAGSPRFCRFRGNVGKFAAISYDWLKYVVDLRSRCVCRAAACLGVETWWTETGHRP